MNKSALISVALIVVLGFAVYANSLAGNFVWDDRYLITDNAYIKSWSNIDRIFSYDIGKGAGVRSGAYRPLQLLGYTLDYALAKLDTRIYHLHNVILHTLAGLCIFWLIQTLFGDWLLSLLSSLFFIAHPIHSEAVSYISGRADPLALVWILLSFVFYLICLNKGRMVFCLLALLSFILALLSRESALILPILFLLYHYCFRRKIKLSLFWPFVAVALAYILFRFFILASVLPHTMQKTALLQRLPGFFAAFANYLRLLFLPFHLHMEYGNPLFSLSNPQVFLGILIFICLLISALRLRTKNSLISFALLWFLITLLPSSNLYPINAYMAEHWLYLPSIGFFLALAYTLRLLYQKARLKTISTVLISFLLGFWCLRTIQQNTYWQDALSFYERTLSYAPLSWRVYNDQGIAYNNAGNYRKAIESFKKAIEIKPDYAEAYSNLGINYRMIGKDKEAIIFLKKAIELNPEMAGPYNNLANAYSLAGQKEEAISLFGKAIELNPDYTEAYNNLANVYCSQGQYEKGINLYQKAISLDPSFVIAYINLGSAYRLMGEYDKALSAYKKALALEPNNEAALYLLQLTLTEKEAVE